MLGEVLAEGALLAALGVGIGLGGALLAGRLLSGLLYGVRPYDPATLAVVGLAMGAVTLIATLLPARSAVRIDPAVALRDEAA